MARTFRRRSAAHTYPAVLRRVAFDAHVDVPDRLPHHPRTPEDRRLRARFHSDGGTRLGPHRAFRRSLHRRLRTLNADELRRVLTRPDHDPVFETRHLHSARRVWDWH